MSERVEYWQTARDGVLDKAQDPYRGATNHHLYYYFLQYPNNHFINKVNRKMSSSVSHNPRWDLPKTCCARPAVKTPKCWLYSDEKQREAAKPHIEETATKKYLFNQLLYDLHFWAYLIN